MARVYKRAASDDWRPHTKPLKMFKNADRYRIERRRSLILKIIYAAILAAGISYFLL